MPDNQLLLALQVASSGADAMRYAAQAIGAFPEVWVSPHFMYNAVTRPLEALADLLGAPPPARPTVTTRLAQQLPAKAKSSVVVKRKVGKKRVMLSVVTKGTGFPLPPDLKGFDLRVNLYGVEPNSVLESAACRALLLEVVRRAAYDWVLYRASSKLVNRQLAESAHTWLFVEKPETATWDLRRRNGNELNGYHPICDLLEIDPEKMRARIRTMTERDIMGAGRPAERRKHKGGGSDDTLHSDDLPVFDVDVDNLPVHDPLYSNYSMEG
jgi:hypothetical protein